MLIQIVAMEELKGIAMGGGDFELNNVDKKVDGKKKEALPMLCSVVCFVNRCSVL
jgi:hypothetical protein